MASILVVDDEAGVREFLLETLAGDGHVLTDAANGADAIDRINQEHYDLLITDLRMPGEIDGLGVLRAARSSNPDMKVILLTAHGTVATAVHAMRLGAHDVLEKPVSGPDELRILISRALDDAAGAPNEKRAARESDALSRNVGRALGVDYELEGPIAKGGYAAVFAVRDRRLERRLAVKCLLPQWASDADTAERFCREARTMARLTHPNIVPVYFVGRERDIPCFVMPFISGGSLAALIQRKRRLGVASVVRIARQIAGALDYAHRMGVIHRDIKPENILFDGDDTSGRFLLCDFGIARALAPRHHSTGPGIFVGTPRYASPEQASGHLEIDVRSDVYSCGIVVYEMLSGKVPFDGPNANRILAQHVVASVPSLRGTVPGVTKAMDRVLACALAKDPADRFETVGAFVLALEIATREPL